MGYTNRRSFLTQTAAGFSAAALASAFNFAALGADGTQSSAVQLPTLKKKYRAAAIGSTGRGDFGHDIDLALVDLPGVEFVAIADDNSAGLKAAGGRCKVDRLYADYRELLDKEKVDLVAVCMRHVDRHEEVSTHCAQAGKHIYTEKPVAADLASLDRMAAACDQAGVKFGVGLPNHVSPAIRDALAMVQGGKLGALRTLRAQGKCDPRGGGEDLVVLGYHMLDLMCLFAGVPRWTFAQVLVGDRDATKGDAHPGTEPVGPVAGDTVAAMFGFDKQVHGYFQSHANKESTNDRFSLEIECSNGRLAIRNLAHVVWVDGLAFDPAKKHQWRSVAVPDWDRMSNADKYRWGHQRLILDVLSAAEEGREPATGIHTVRWTQELIQSIYASHLAQARVALPLKERTHPLL